MTTTATNSTTAAAARDAAPARSDRFPPGIPYIVGNEGAERFSFYGMRQILYIYLTALFIRFVAEAGADPALLGNAKVRATQVVHLFMAGVYAFPMIGAIVADRLLGKYRVIFWVSLVYCAGHAALALAGRAGALGKYGLAEVGMYAGLALIAIGSGGIKPCVSANVGDQFTAENGHLVSKVFQIFYFMINFGSFFATIITPLLFKKISAEVAFAVPGILMGIAAVVFWAGRNRFVKVPPKSSGRLGALDVVSSVLFFVPLGALVVGFFTHGDFDAGRREGFDRVAFYAGAIAATYWPHLAVSVAAPAAGLWVFARRQRIEADTGFLSVCLYAWSHRKERKPGEGWFETARARFGEAAAEGPPAVLRIMLVFSMVSVFWALFDQHSSTWVEQAKHMGLLLVAPYWVWTWFVLPATIVLALFGAAWLFLWVANRPISRAVTRAFLAAVVLWGAGSAGLQLLWGGSTTIELQPAQIASLNPLMVMIIIPFLNFAVYGPLERRGRPVKPLSRMTVGMFLASTSFVAVALLQAVIESSPKGSVHVMWQTFPFLLLTTAEVLVSVTGLEFAYTQAPLSMKSTIMGFWLLCVTFGNILVAFLAPLQKLSLSRFFWVFAGLCFLAAAIFGLLARRYKGKTYLQEARS